MGIRVLRGRSVALTVGTPWRMDFEVCTSAYVLTLAADPPVVTVTLPDTTTVLPDVTALDGWNAVWAYGRYTALYTPLVTGRFTARAVTAESGQVDLLAVVSAAVVAPPTSDDLDDYLGGPTEHGWTEDEMTSALDAETVAQFRVCRVPGSYPADLREALLRRAARTLHMRRQLTAEPRGEGDVDLPEVRPVAADPEIRRLEKPYRRLPVG